MILSTLVLFDFWTGASGADAPVVAAVPGGHFAPVGRRKKPREEYEEIRRELEAVMAPPVEEVAEVPAPFVPARFDVVSDPSRFDRAGELAARLVEIAEGLNRAAKRQAQVLAERVARERERAEREAAAHAAAVREVALAAARRKRKILAAVAFMWGDE